MNGDFLSRFDNHRKINLTPEPTEEQKLLAAIRAKKDLLQKVGKQLNQEDIVLEQLLIGNTITHFKAEQLAKITKVNTRISNLRRIYGYDAIKTEMKKSGTKVFAEYSWVGL